MVFSDVIMLEVVRFQTIAVNHANQSSPGQTINRITKSKTFYPGLTTTQVIWNS